MAIVRAAVAGKVTSHVKLPDAASSMVKWKFDSFITHQNMRKDLEKSDRIGATAYQEEQKEKKRSFVWLWTCWDFLT